jgi:hypothetical protein
MRLTIELVPQTSFYTNVRSNVTKKEWDVIRNKCYIDAKHKCEICGGIGKKHAVECHEVWQYDDEKHTQTLVGLIALCPSCHRVKHAGLAQVKGLINQVIKQLMKVNGISFDDAIQYIDNSFDIWEKRSKFKWKLDISYLDNYK